MKVNNITEEAVAEEVATVQVNEEVKKWQQMYMKMHTPFKREYPKIGRNKICPFCDSGLKFKKCKCYQTYGQQSSY